MTKKHLLSYILLTIGGLSACVGEKEKPVSFWHPPALSPEQMVNLLVDTHLSEAHTKHNPSVDMPEEDVFRKHHISEQSYRQTYRYYALQVPLMHEIYRHVVDSLAKLQRPQVLSVSDSTKHKAQL